ncbi:FapA family protein [Natronincola ferrireducens]|uniref:RNA-binding protein KhpB N-terminal domain-containing protein n=1 Tax=Natronincola ferrireducens TaxID=393762 RepID=A0A1G9C4N5_9FIRM|nr:FapA family protein [Natronincola ferrireducens]SDK46305.1 hypothetical protein SAMN05660472_01354 [Natronincola ferrireducens]
MSKKFIVIEGHSYENALNKGLRELKITEKDVNVEVLEEKKSFIFRKDYIKLKITLKEEVTENPLVNITDELEKEANETFLHCHNDKIHREHEKIFEINYLPDGVYLSITKSISESNQEVRQKIIDYLEKKSIEDFEIEAIDTYFSENINKPMKIAPYQVEKLIDGDVVIEISKNKLEAYISITKADGGKAVTFDVAKEKLKDKGIVYGIDEEKLQTIIENNLFHTKMLVAQGKKPEAGKDGSLRHHYDTDGEIKPKILEDGTVDFKQLNLVKNVKKGQLLVEIIPPTEGVAGINIFGEEIPPQKGKAAKLIKGKNIIESEDGLKVYAATEGQVHTKDGKLQVSEIYEIVKDIDNGTGNIKFNGKVIVKGNVKSGFTVEAEGDIEVNGVVEGATLLAKGDIILNRGIQGNNQAYLECNGNLIAKYIENSRIKSLGNIEADCILHSNVVAKEAVKVLGKKGLIAGGHIRAGKEVSAKIIGSHMGTVTKIEVGIDPDDKAKHEKIKEEIVEIEKNLINLKKTIELLNKTGKNSGLEQNKKEFLIKSIKTYDYLKGKHGTMSEEFKMLEFKMQNLSIGKIHVMGKMYPGVKVGISNAVKHIYDELNRSTLYKKEGEIVIGPYEK